MLSKFYKLTVGAMIIALCFMNPQIGSPEGSSYKYAVGKGGKITFYKSGKVKEITGLAICTRDEVSFNMFLKTIAGVIVKPNPSAPTPPDEVFYLDTLGNPLLFRGVPIVLERDSALDAEVGMICGSPDGFTPFAFSTVLGPDGADIPLSTEFQVVFLWNDSTTSPKLAEDPMFVVTDDAVSMGGMTEPLCEPVDRTSAVNDFKLNGSMRISPNPTRGFTHIQFSSVERIEAKVYLYDINGKIVTQLFEGPINNNQIHKIEKDFSHLPSGLYFIQLLAEDNRSLVKKMLVQSN